MSSEDMKNVWLPLEQKIGAAACADFMFMGMDNSGTVYLYKHRMTREYLYLGASGQCYAVDGSKTVTLYAPITDQAALEQFGLPVTPAMPLSVQQFLNDLRATPTADEDLDAVALLDIAAKAQIAYWDALAALEKSLGFEVEGVDDLSATTVERLIENNRIETERQAPVKVTE